MEFDVLLGLFLRWMHIMAACAAVGGMLFMRVALVPAASTLGEPQRDAFFAAVRSRWSKVVMISILFLVVSGLVNFILIRNMFISGTPALKLPTSYNMLFGIKTLIALVVFYFASALTGRGEGTAGIRRNAKLWLNVNLVLLVVLVVLSNMLRATHMWPQDYKPKFESQPVVSMAADDR